MINFPNAKINLGLRVTAKREDGYHDLDTVFYPVPLCDILEVVVNPGPDASPLVFTSTGRTIPQSKSGNTCTKAIGLIRSHFPDLPPLQVHLHKIIPMGAGLGGGSSDGAFMLMLLNDKFNLSLSKEQLMAYALQLGSDCPFFILNSPAYATGRGEKLTPVALDLSKKTMAVVSPGIHVSTAAAFSKISIADHAPSCASVLSLPIERWKDMLVNDFEKNVFSQFPEIEEIKNHLYERGAIYASMTGTGSTVYGIFDSEPELNGLFPANYEVSIIAQGRVRSVKHV